MRHGLLVSLSLTGLVLATGCGSSSSDNATGTGNGNGTGTTATGAGTIGASGGVVTSADGVVTLTIPSGALSSDTSVSVSPTASPGTGSIGQVYDLAPSGTTFTNPVTLSFSLAGIDAGAIALDVATYAQSAWQPVASTATKSAVSAQITHFSPWGIVAATGTLGSTMSTSGDVGCEPGAACTGTEACGGGTSGGTSIRCACESSVYVCSTSTGGTTSSDGGASDDDGDCSRGAACSAGSGCGNAASGGNPATSCTCVNGTYSCTTGTPSDGGSGISDASVGGTCAQGSVCTGSEMCGAANAGGGETNCTCMSGTYSCITH